MNVEEWVGEGKAALPILYVVITFISDKENKDLKG